MSDPRIIIAYNKDCKYPVRAVFIVPEGMIDDDAENLVQTHMQNNDYVDSLLELGFQCINVLTVEVE